MVELALYQPDIPQNLGTIIRLCACMGQALHIIEPCGFPLDDRRLRRAAMDYYDHATIQRHVDWDTFRIWIDQNQRRLILLTTKSKTAYYDYEYTKSDVLLFGRESAGVPEAVHQSVNERVTIPMRGECRSLNLALSTAIVAGEAARQLQQ